MRYFLIVLITGCVISCGQNSELNDPNISPSAAEKTQKSDSLIEEDTVTPPADEDSESVGTVGTDLAPSVVPSTVADSEVKMASVAEGEAGSQIASSIISPEHKMAHRLVRFVKSELKKDGRVSSFVFDRYIEMLVKDSLEGYKNNEGKIDRNEWLKNSGFFEPPDTAPSYYGLENHLLDLLRLWPDKFPSYYRLEKDMVFYQLARLNYERQKGGDFIGTIPIEGRKETVVFITSLNLDSDSNGLDINPDRIVIMRSPGLLDFVRGKDVFQDRNRIEEQAQRLVQLTSHVRKANIPVHIMGMCDYFCSSYLIPQAKEIYIEPFGEVTFNGSHDVIFETFRNLLSKAKESHWNAIKEEITDLDSFNGYVHRHLQLEQPFYEYLAKLGRDVLISTLKNVTGERAFEDLSLEEKKAILKGLSLYDRSTIRGFFHSGEKSQAEEKIDTIRDILKRLAVFNQYFPNRYFGSRNYNLERFFYYTGLLTNSSFAGTFNDSSKSRYYVSKENVSGDMYSHTSARSVLLSKLGINIVQGENSGYRDYVLKYQLRKLPILIISEDKLVNCGFFNGGINTPQLITNCFSKH